MHSSVFARMFAAGLLETQDHNITITDFQYEPVRAMIEYMYKPDKLYEQPKRDNKLKDESGDSQSGWKSRKSRHIPPFRHELVGQLIDDESNSRIRRGCARVGGQI